MKRFFALTTAVTLLGTLLTTTQAGLAQTARQKPDARLRAALDREDYKYEVTERGNFRVTIRFRNQRRQVGAVFSTTTKLGGMEIRQICSTAYESSGALPSEIANRLLVDTTNKKLGAWESEQSGGKASALFCSKVPANLSSTDLISAIEATLETADQMEQQLTGKDQF